MPYLAQIPLIVRIVSDMLRSKGGKAHVGGRSLVGGIGFCCWQPYPVSIVGPMHRGSLTWRLETALNCHISYEHILSLILNSRSQTFNCHSPGSHTFMPTVQHIPRGTAPHAVWSLTPTPPCLLIGRDRRPNANKWHTSRTLGAFRSSSILDSAPGVVTGLGVQFGNWTGGLPAVILDARCSPRTITTDLLPTSHRVVSPISKVPLAFWRILVLMQLYEVSRIPASLRATFTLCPSLTYAST